MSDRSSPVLVREEKQRQRVSSSGQPYSSISAAGYALRAATAPDAAAASVVAVPLTTEGAPNSMLSDGRRALGPTPAGIACSAAPAAIAPLTAGVAVLVGSAADAPDFGCSGPGAAEGGREGADCAEGAEGGEVADGGWPAPKVGGRRCCTACGSLPTLARYEAIIAASRVPVV